MRNTRNATILPPRFAVIRAPRTTGVVLGVVLALALLVVRGTPVVAAQEHDRATESSVRGELLAGAARYSPEYTRRVLNDAGEPLAYFADLNADERLDLALLTVVDEPGVEPRAAVLSDPSRLYSDQTPDPRYILEIYYAGQEAIVTVNLGARIVWDGMALVELTPDPVVPGITLTFRSSAGSETELVVFQGSSISRVSLVVNRNQSGELVDVDDDGIMEVVLARRVPEAGRGFETFLELRELTHNGYQRAASLPLVRSLNGFLDRAAEAMEAERWDELRGLARRPAGDGVPPARPVEHAGSADQAPLLSDLFGAIADDETIPITSFAYPGEGTDIAGVTFPRLIDNPFPEPFRGQDVRLVFRVDCCDGERAFYQARVGLDPNPFAGTPFAFLTHVEGEK